MGQGKLAHPDPGKSGPAGVARWSAGLQGISPSRVTGSGPAEVRDTRQAELEESGPVCLFRFFLYCLLISCYFFPPAVLINHQLSVPRGYIPDISPRGYAGLEESCIVLPKIGIAELVLKSSQLGLNPIYSHHRKY